MEVYMERIQITDIRDIESTCASSEEQETTINIMRKEDTVSIWTCDNTMITRLSNVMRLYPETWKCFEGGRDSNGKVYGYFFECPKKAISFRSGATVRRTSKQEQEEEE